MKAQTEPEPLLSPTAPTPAVSDDDLIHCVPIYCPTMIGEIDDEMRAKLAIIKIWRGEKPKARLEALYPKCNLEGQAYVLAALWHFDQDAFRRLAADFVRHNGSIQVASGCFASSESPAELVKDMQKTNCALAFSDPPFTKEEILRRAYADATAHYEAFRKTEQWKKAESEYKLGSPEFGMAGWTVEITSKITKSSKMPFTIDWGWEQSKNVWSPTVGIEDITEVVHEIEKTPFIQAIDSRFPLDIYLEAVSSNLHERESIDVLDPDINFDMALVKAAGYSGTNKLVKITARSEADTLILWHPKDSQFWLITRDLQFSTDWYHAYKKQTGLELTNTEIASGWAATCDNDGILKMVRCPDTKTIEDRVQESINHPGEPK